MLHPRTSWGVSLKPAKIDNTAIAVRAKIKIRENVIEVLGLNGGVFDAFAGDGLLWRHVWHRAHHYVGCDQKWHHDDRLIYVADSRRVMRALPLQNFSIFDFDAYGSPWEHVLILCARRQLHTGERLGLVLTEGSALKIHLGGMPLALSILTGLRPMPGLSRAQNKDKVLDLALTAAARRLKGKITHRWQAEGKTSAQVRYVGLVLTGA